jgi:hypothetical protein
VKKTLTKLEIKSKELLNQLAIFSIQRKSFIALSQSKKIVFRVLKTRYAMLKVIFDVLTAK